MPPVVRAASSSVCVPRTFVRKKRPGSTTARLLCDSAAKLTMVSISSSRRTRSANSRSPMSPSTKTNRSSTSSRLARFPAYVSRSRTTTWSSGWRSSQKRTKLEPMNPAPPVTRIRIGGSLVDGRSGSVWSKADGSCGRIVTPLLQLPWPFAAVRVDSPPRGPQTPRRENRRPLPVAKARQALAKPLAPVREPRRLRLLAAQHRVRRPRRGASQLLRRDRHDAAFELRLLEDRLRELGPGALAVGGGMPDPERQPDDLPRCLR